MMSEVSYSEARTMSDEEKQQLLYPDIDDRIGLGVVVGTIFFFAIVNTVLLWLSKRVVTLQKTSDWRWRNLAVSWVHANICTVGIWYCYSSYREHIKILEDMIDLRPYAAYMLTAFSTGYFVFDFLDHAQQGVLLKQWEVTLHHVAVLYIFGYNLVYQTAVAFSVLALMVEINSVFLHGRKLLQMVQMPFSHWFYRTTVALNLATFLFFRGAAMVLIWAGLLYSRHKISTVYFIGLSLVMVFMVVLNPVLFWRLLKSDVFRRSRKEHQKDGHVTENDITTELTPVLDKSDVTRQSNGACCKSKQS